MSDSGHGAAGTGETAETVTILYENYRGETAVRRITPIGREWFGSSEWHPEPQWLFSAFDMDKEAFRDFARAGVKAWGQAAVDAALASPRADSDERTAGEALKEACKPWEHYTGEPPDDGSPLSGVFVAGMVYTERLLAKLLDVAHYEGGDGSEDFDADATQTLRNILTGARLWDADENRPVSATPAQPAGAVPDSLRALLKEARDGLAAYTGGPDGACSETITRIDALLASHPAGQSAGTGAETVLASDGFSGDLIEVLRPKPAPDSTRTGQGEAPRSYHLEAMRLLQRLEMANVGGFYVCEADREEGEGIIAETLAALAARPAAPEAQGLERVRHVKRGTEYEVLHRGVELQIATHKMLLNDFALAAVEGDRLVIYQGSDGKLWAREETEFDDGRFEPAPPASSGQGGR